VELDPGLKNVLIKRAIGGEINAVSQASRCFRERPSVSLSFFANLGVPFLPYGLMFNYLDGRVEGFELDHSGELVAVRGIYDYFEIVESRAGVSTNPKVQWEFLKRMCRMQNGPVHLIECCDAATIRDWRYTLGIRISDGVIH
jgi:hypothetical protein